ncbi:unnamed protein product [Polarella glacialis]|uniref:Rab-GAP TBC domain-containing protein n=1 Tax=Polarella glacialis TaxID=89957 RepID=A0A813L104_POLGL|nr:unnamed protein product [Polarella glacialis]
MSPRLEQVSTPGAGEGQGGAEDAEGTPASEGGLEREGQEGEAGGVGETIGNASEDKVSQPSSPVQPESSPGGLSQSILDVIEADVLRTFPNNAVFLERGGPDQLRCVLKEFAARDPELGYCQSLNFIAAIFIMALPDGTSALHALEQLIVKLGTRRWYTDGMKQLRADTVVLEDLLRERLPAVYNVFRAHKFDLIFITSKWFLCLFAATLPDEALRRVWDVLLCDGIETVFRVSFALLALKADAILQTASMDDLVCMLQEWQPDYSPEVLIQSAYNPALIGQISRSDLAQRRRAAADKVSSADTRAEMRNTHLRRGGVRPASIYAR